MKTDTLLPKHGIFFFEHTAPINRRYWVGTFTEDRTACEKLIEYAAGYGKDALKDAKSICKRLNKKNENRNIKN